MGHSHLHVVVGLSGLLFAASRCAAPPPAVEEPPFGVLPSAVTSAEPLWIPFQVRAGSPVTPPAASVLQGLRQLTTDGKAGAGVFTPDGQAVIFETGAGDGQCGQLVKLDLQSGKRTSLALGDQAVAAPRFSADGKRLGFHSADGQLACSTWGARGDTSIRLATSANSRVTPSAAATSAHVASAPATAASANATSATAASPSASASSSAKPTNVPSTSAPWARSSVWLSYPLSADPRSQTNAAKVSARGHHGWPALLADGQGMIFSASPLGDVDLYAQLGSGAPERLTRAPGFDGFAQLSPDGTRLTWMADRIAGADAQRLHQQQLAAGHFKPRKLVVMLAGAHGQHPQPIAAFGSHCAMPTFAHDSRHVLFVSDRDHHGDGARNYDIYRIDPDAGSSSLGHPPLQRLSYHDAYDGAPSVSPDGGWLLFTSSRGAKRGETNLFVARLPEAR